MEDEYFWGRLAWFVGGAVGLFYGLKLSLGVLGSVLNGEMFDSEKALAKAKRLMENGNDQEATTLLKRIVKGNIAPDVERQNEAKDLLRNIYARLGISFSEDEERRFVDRWPDPMIEAFRKDAKATLDGIASNKDVSRQQRILGKTIYGFCTYTECLECDREIRDSALDEFQGWLKSAELSEDNLRVLSDALLPVASFRVKLVLYCEWFLLIAAVLAVFIGGASALRTTDRQDEVIVVFGLLFFLLPLSIGGVMVQIKTEHPAARLYAIAINKETLLQHLYPMQKQLIALKIAIICVFVISAGGFAYKLWAAQ